MTVVITVNEAYYGFGSGQSVSEAASSVESAFLQLRYAPRCLASAITGLYAQTPVFLAMLNKAVTYDVCYRQKAKT